MRTTAEAQLSIARTCLLVTATGMQYGVSMLKITAAAGERGPVLILSGESDTTTVGQLRDALDAQISDGARRLTVDLAGLEFADSAVIGALLVVHRVLQERGGGLELAFPQRAVARSLSLLGVDRMLEVRTRTRADSAGDGPDSRLPAGLRLRMVLEPSPGVDGRSRWQGRPREAGNGA
jgi:anti-sigma B factor antagonist